MIRRALLTVAFAIAWICAALAQGGMGPGPGTPHTTSSNTVSISCPGTGTTSSSITCSGTYTGTAPATTGWTYSWNSPLSGSGSVTSVASVSGGSITGIVVSTPSGAGTGTVTLTTNIPTSGTSGSLVISSPSPFAYLPNGSGVSPLGVNGGTTSSYDTTGAKIVIIGETWSQNAFGTTPPAVSDNKGNTCTALTPAIPGPSSPDSPTVLFRCTGGSFGTGHTFTATGMNSYAAFGIMAFSDSGSLGTVDQQNGNAPGSTPASLTSISPGAVTPGVNNELIVSFVGNYIDATTSQAIDSSFALSPALRVPYTSSGTITLAYAMNYKIQTTAATVTPTWTWTTAVITASSVIATFKP
jgi:hypothetical protein